MTAMEAIQRAIEPGELAKVRADFEVEDMCEALRVWREKQQWLMAELKRRIEE